MTDTQALLERLNKQVEVGMFAMDSPITFRECHDTIEALSSALAAAERERDAMEAVLRRFVDQARVGSGNKAVTRSARVNCPVGIFHDARAALPAKQEPSQ